MKIFYTALLIISFSIISILLIACHKDQTPKISIDELNELVSTDHDYILLDVRTPEETAAGKIANAQEADVKTAEFINLLSSFDKEKKYIVYCRSGKRSTKACQMMKEQGFKHLLNVEGGYLAYTAKR